MGVTGVNGMYGLYGVGTPVRGPEPCRCAGRSSTVVLVGGALCGMPLEEYCCRNGSVPEGLAAVVVTVAVLRSSGAGFLVCLCSVEFVIWSLTSGTGGAGGGPGLYVRGVRGGWSLNAGDLDDSMRLAAAAPVTTCTGGEMGRLRTDGVRGWRGVFGDDLADDDRDGLKMARPEDSLERRWFARALRLLPLGGGVATSCNGESGVR